MNPEYRCPRCGHAVPLDAMHGVCPACAAQAEAAPTVQDSESPAFIGPEASSAQIGTTIGRYKILEQIGEGGCGIVYRAEQETPVRRQVALKVIRRGMETESVIARFEAERQALAVMDHPNIAKVLDGGTTDTGQPYFVMEFVRGIRITEYCDTACLDIGLRLNLFVQVCQAVQHAHQKGIIHRDLKPSNILVAFQDNQPIPKVIDFGIAKAIAGDLVLSPFRTAIHELVGTPAYMSPEQADMSALDIDTRSDIFSLGVVLHELLVGVTPLDPDRLRKSGIEEVRRLLRDTDYQRPSTRLGNLGHEHAEAVARRRRESLQTVIQRVRGDLDWIILKCLERDRTRRYETANGLAMDIQRHLRFEPVIARPPTAGYRLQKLVRRNRASFAALGAVSMALLLGAVISMQQAIRARQAEADALQERAISERAREEAERSQRATQTLLADTLVAAGISADRDSRWPEAVLWFARSLSLTEGDSTRNPLDRRRVENWMRAVPRPVRALPHGEPDVFNLGFHPSEPFLHTRGKVGGWKIWNWMEEKIVPLPGGITNVTWLTWSTDGRLLAIAVPEEGVRIHQFPEGTLVRTIRQPGQVRHIAFSPDSQRMGIAGAETRVWRVETGEPMTIPLHSQHQGVAIVFAPRGDRVAVICGDGGLTVHDIDVQNPSENNFAEVSTKYRPDLTNFLFDLHPVFVAGGTGLVFQESRSTLVLRDSRTGKIANRFAIQSDTNKPRVGISSFWISTNHSLVYMGGHGYLTQAGLFNQSHRFLSTGNNSVSHMAESPDGRWLAVASLNRTVKVYPYDRGTPNAHWIHHQTAVHEVAFSPDSRLLATSQDGGLVRIWLLPDGAGPTYTADLAGGPSLVRLSSDGRAFLPRGTSFRESKLPSTRVQDISGRGGLGLELEAGDSIADARFHPNGDSVLIVAGKTVQTWDWRSGRQMLAPVQCPDTPKSADYSKDGEHIAVLLETGDIQILQARTGRQIREIAQPGARISYNDYIDNGSVVFAPDGESLVSWTKDGLLWVWDYRRGTARYPPLRHGQRVHQVTFSADGRLMATAAYDSNARVFDLATGKLLSQELNHPDWVFVARFDAEGGRLLTSCRDGQARLWNWRTGTLLIPPLSHEDEVFDAQFSPDQRHAFTGSADGTVRAWELATGRPVSPAIEVGFPVWQVAVPPSGDVLVAAGEAAEVMIFNLGFLRIPNSKAPPEITTYAELISGKRIHEGGTVNLTPAEWLERWRTFRPTLGDKLLPTLNGPD